MLGGTIDGNGLVWSIGGPSKAAAPVGGLTGGLLGTPQGLSGSHNKYESDVSPGRGDLYQFGNDFTLQMSQYQELYDMAIANGDNIDLPMLTDFRSKRFDQSVANNVSIIWGFGLTLEDVADTCLALLLQRTIYRCLCSTCCIHLYLPFYEQQI